MKTGNAKKTKTAIVIAQFEEVIEKYAIAERREAVIGTGIEVVKDELFYFETKKAA